MDNSPESQGLTRRAFNRLSMAALGGAVVGAIAGSGCSKSEPEAGALDPTALLQEPHVCRGLNTCKGKGAGGSNTCAGTGACATAAHHSCHGENECKGQGGCGASAGQNACKGQGECGVPLNDATWAKARAAFEKQAVAMSLEVGAAPAAP